jgi:ABC-type bacteriocin/lantibiotic exporter with double-glycine peptidase domain
MTIPALLFVDQESHCLVLESVNYSQNKITIWDPATFTINEIIYDDLKERWDGEVILFSNNSLGSNWIKWNTIINTFLFRAIFFIDCWYLHFPKNSGHICISMFILIGLFSFF